MESYSWVNQLCLDRNPYETQPEACQTKQIPESHVPYPPTYPHNNFLHEKYGKI